jgi:hypothetical protein
MVSSSLVKSLHPSVPLNGTPPLPIPNCRIAGIDRQPFDQELARRRIPSFTEEMLDDEIANLRQIFPR